MSTNRRELSFANWEEALSDLWQLQERGYDRVGKWDLGQACKHLNDWLTYPLTGFPIAPLPIRWLMLLMRVSMGQRLLKKTIATGKMAAGGPTLSETVYTSPRDCDPAIDWIALRKLEDTIERFRGHTGPIYASPLFGTMDKETAERLQFVHFAHHLSFLIPKSG